MKQYSPRFASLLMFAALIFPLGALGHTGVVPLHGFQSGVLHPFSGLDHLAAMIAVGLWAAQLGGRAIWLVPASAALGQRNHRCSLCRLSWLCTWCRNAAKQ